MENINSRNITKEEKINKLKEELYILIDKKGLSHRDTVNKSQQIDEELNKLYKTRT